MCQECPLVQDLNTYKLATSPQTSTLTSRIFSVLFPGSPAVNALLATLYISGPPNFLLALCPPNIDPSSLSVMVAFAGGGLLGDTLFHLLPEIFLGEDSPQHVRFVLVEPNRNLLLGAAILVGFVTFVAMDKGLRIATGGEGHEHGHGSGSLEIVKPVGSSSAVEGSPAKSARSRKKGDLNGHAEVVVVKEEKEINASVKLAGYLNLM
jgi:solute carrier family 39 (zinc transporter), member 7